MTELPCGCIEDNERHVTVFRCKKHKKTAEKAAEEPFYFEREPVGITKHYFNGELVWDGTAVGFSNAVLAKKSTP